MAYHAGLPIPGGFTGVDIFFVISGFVITSLLLRERASSGTVSLARFYARRAKRLLPALAITSITTCILAIPLLSLEAQRSTGRTGAAAAVFVANLEIMRVSGGYFDPVAERNGLLHTWSLSVEEQFYAVFPALLLLAWGLARRTHMRAGVVLLASVGLGTVTSFTLSTFLSLGGQLPRFYLPSDFAFYSSVTRAWEFGVGALLALVPALSTRSVRGVPASISLVAGLALLLASGLLVRGGSGFPGLSALVPVAAAALLIVGGRVERHPVSRFLSSRPLVGIGDLSYSLYLWHWPVLVLGLSAIDGADDQKWLSTSLVALSTIPAWASYRWIESPIRSMDALQGVRVAAVAGVCIGASLAVGLFVARGAAAAWGAPDVQIWETLRTATAVGRENGCHVETAADLGTELGDCTFGSTDRGLVYLVGDSHADALSDVALSAAQARGYGLVVRSASGCPFLKAGADWFPGGVSLDADVCDEVIRSRLGEIESLKPDLVIVANRSPEYIDLAHSIPGARDELTLAQDWSDGVREILEELHSAGTRALLALTVPEREVSMAECAFRGGIDENCVRGRRAYALDRRSPVVELELVATQVDDLAAVWDPLPILCPQDACLGSEAGRPLYRDDNHLTPAAASLLTDSLGAAIDAAVPTTRGLPPSGDSSALERRS